ncbi:MAG TPA: thiol:disulfide interchange protein DsbG [Gammaproteobacteria bacterium]|nr:thiol:disulfide interchange protein DsbG [Gammaproteobacteria bacterium]
MLRSKGIRRFVLSVAVLSASLASAATLAADPPLWQRLGQATWVAEGATHPQHLFYVVTDANCPYCNELWQKLRPFYGQGLQVRYVMVGILADSSPGKAAAILEARDPAAALDQDEAQYGKLPDDLGGGIRPVSKPKPRTLALLKSNERLMYDLGAQGTPVLIYLDSKGELRVIQSVPPEAALPDIVRDAAP